MYEETPSGFTVWSNGEWFHQGRRGRGCDFPLPLEVRGPGSRCRSLLSLKGSGAGGEGVPPMTQHAAPRAPPHIFWRQHPNLISFKNLVIAVCMFAAAGMTLALKPTEKVADPGPRVDLEVLIPNAFGGLYAQVRAAAVSYVWLYLVREVACIRMRLLHQVKARAKRSVV